MHKIDSSTTTATMPSPLAVGTPGWFQHGNPGTGTAYTVLTSDWANAIQAELLNVLTAAVITPDKTSQSQLLAALRALAAPAGQCRLNYVSSTSISMMPYQGNQLTINGTNYDIPQAGVALANTGLVATTLYFVYAFMSSGVMTLEASATGHSTDATAINYGVEIKTGDSSRTLIGMVYTGAGTPGIFTSPSSLNQTLLNWFNQRTLTLAGSAVIASTASTSLVTVGTASTLNFLSWGTSDTLMLTCSGVISNATAGSGAATAVMLDGSSVGTTPFGTSATAALSFPICSVASLPVSAGFHTAQPGLSTNGAGGTASCNIALEGFCRG